MEWSYRTLDPDSARLLRWLSVYANPVDLATAEWLAGGDPLPALGTLVDKSLLYAEPAVTGTTYRMLDPIRSYAARALVDAGEERAARERHVAWSLHALEQARLGPDGRPGTLSLHPLDKLADEVRAALRWCVTGGTVGPALRLVGGMEQWWRERGLAREGRLWLFRLYGRIAETGERIGAGRAGRRLPRPLAAGRRRRAVRRAAAATRSGPRPPPNRPATTAYWPGYAPGAALPCWTWAGRPRPSGCAGK